LRNYALTREGLVPQLTFNREITPRRITVTLDWNQLASITTLAIDTCSQDFRPQTTLTAEVTKLSYERIADVIHSAFMVWSECTPGEATRHARALLKEDGVEVSATFLRV
jgi:hypothetical protein